MNFVELLEGNEIKIRTYERGVEDETYSCGTDVTAASIASFLETKKGHQSWSIITLGGNLSVSFEEQNGVFTKVKLIGPAITTFAGRLD